MGTLEVVLLILGAVIFIISFLIPDRTGNHDTIDKTSMETQWKELAKEEIKEIKSKIEDIADETVQYAVEKSERALERISNEKIMAVSEYSDTVLDDIHKNHKEVLFLYDMLNAKQEDIKNTAKEVNLTQQEVKQTAKAIEDAKTMEAVMAQQEEVDFVPIKPTTIEMVSSISQIKLPRTTLKNRQLKRVEHKISDSSKKESLKESNKEIDINPNPNSNMQQESVGKTADEVANVVKEDTKKATNVTKKKTTPKKAKQVVEDKKPLDIQFADGTVDNRNNNEKILALHNSGKSNVMIAKELGLGIGEVKLVIDLFKGI